MGDVQPKFTPGAGFTVTASDVVTGGRLVEITGGRRVAHAGANSEAVVGVALRDAVAEAELPIETRGVFKLLAAGAVGAGDRVCAAAAGAVAARVAQPAEQVVGIALEAIADGASGLVMLNLS